MTHILHTSTEDTMSIYLAEIACYPLLSAAEEIELATQYEQGRAARSQLEERFTFDDQERQQLERAVERGDRARQRLVECNLRLVIRFAKHYMNCGLPFVDLIQEGNIGLMKAVEGYDHRRGFRFATYAGWWIRQTLRRAVTNQAQVIRFPVWVYDKLSRLRRVSDDLTSDLGQRPNPQELAERMGEPVSKVKQLLRSDCGTVSLDMPVRDGDGGSADLIDLVPDPDTPPVEELLMRRQFQECVRDAMRAHLDPRECEVLRRRFGLEDGQKRTLEQVAQVFGVTRERVRQIERKALKQLRRAGTLRRIAQV